MMSDMPDILYVDEKPTDKEPYAYFYQAIDKETAGWLKQTMYLRADLVYKHIQTLKRIRDYDQNQPFWKELNDIVNTLERGTDKAGR